MLTFITIVDCLFLAPRPQDTQGQPPSLVAGMPVGSGITPQAAFYYRNVWLPLVVNITATQGSQKTVL